MNIIGYLANIWAAVRGREPSPRSEANPFYMSFTAGTARPQPKVSVNYTKLRAFSESPIPRRAVDYLKNQVAALDWDLVSLDGKALNGRQKKQSKIVKNILNAPNSHESWKSFIEQLVEDRLVIGQAAAEKREWKTNPDKPLILYPIDGSSVQIYTDWDGSPSSPRYAQVDRWGNTVKFLDSQLLYMRHNPRTSTPWGLSPLEVAAQNIEYLLATQASAARESSSATKRKIIDFGEGVDQEQLKELRAYWQSEVEGRGRQPIIGSGSAKTLELGAANDEALFLKWQSFLINQIANAFGMDGQKFQTVLATKSNGDVMDDSTDEGAVRPLAYAIEDMINREIIQYLGYNDIEFKFRWTANLRDRKTLTSILQIQVQQNIVTIDEARRELGYEPLDDGKGQYTLSEFLAIYAVANTNALALPAGVTDDEKKAGLNPAQTDGANQTPALKESPQNQNATKDPLK